ncbi:signal peptide, CUB and EGF-like domain-containing protein 3 [Physella acuta]|uniref:signal peptide, CUB and EGF-like domain-containing protein 3 n=1 Tax=Physella acuta TaxID=109671 RepID=UPI0027DE362C|nr:signal peptide, CUB and EGF-like domain-containing protein 3 [Physella acuta]
MTKDGFRVRDAGNQDLQVLCRSPGASTFSYIRNNLSCIDNCLSSPCQQNCTNLIGSYNCGCYHGYTLKSDNKTCEDVDECQTTTHNCSQLCNNTVGGYACSCHQGYELHNDSRFLCVDVDECGLETDNCSDGCNNTAGSYVCTCKDGYHIDTHDPFTCVDMDECQQGRHNCTQNCTNSIGSYVCSCFHGYRLDNNDNVTCLDINECKENLHTCENTCVNTLGSYTCTCPLGYQLDQDGSSCVKTRSQPSCLCSCRTQTRINMSSTLMAVQKEIDQIKNNLTVETHDLSSYIRSKTSATDDRMTSQTVGLFGAILFGITMAVVVVPDVITLIKFLLSKLRLYHRGYIIKWGDTMHCEAAE